MGDDAEVDKVLADAKASLKEIMDGFPDPEEEPITSSKAGGLIGNRQRRF